MVQVGIYSKPVIVCHEQKGVDIVWKHWLYNMMLCVNDKCPPMYIHPQCYKTAAIENVAIMLYAIYYSFRIAHKASRITE